jgi:hypothetical protein
VRLGRSEVSRAHSQRDGDGDRFAAVHRTAIFEPLPLFHTEVRLRVTKVEHRRDEYVLSHFCRTGSIPGKTLAEDCHFVLSRLKFSETLPIWNTEKKNIIITHLAPAPRARVSRVFFCLTRVQSLSLVAAGHNTSMPDQIELREATVHG